jgi:hypothetical protein
MIKKRNYLLICMLVLVLIAPTATSLHTDILTPPNPPTINGPHCGKINTNYTFTINASIDSEGDLYYFILDWGDGNISGWLGPYPSDQIFTVTHQWSEPGTYSFRLKVKDPFGAESDWSELFTIYITSRIILIGFVQGAGNLCVNCTILNMSIALIIKLKPVDLKLYSSIQVLLLNDEFHGLIGSRFFAVVGYGLSL